MSRDASRLRASSVGHRALVVVMVLCLSTILLIDLASSSSAYPQQTGSLNVASGTLAPGHAVDLTGGGFASGAAISVYVFSTPQLLAKATADATGAIAVSVTLPRDLPPGGHTLQAIGPAPDGGTNVLSASFTVASSSVGAPSSTGFPVLPVVGVGVLLLVVGTLLRVTIRRPRV